MTRLRFVEPLVAVCCALLSPSLFAAPLDKSANAKIDEAINVHYLSTDFRKAEAVLRGTIEACGERCSSAVIARAWMYIGIVRGAGQLDLAGAKTAFKEAVAANDGIKLDTDLSTDELRELFASVGGTESEPVKLEEATDTYVENGALPGGMTCTPIVTEVETRRAIPVACRSSKAASRAVLFYREFGSPNFSQVSMELSGSDWLGQIPCSATSLQGELEWYVVALSTDGKHVDSFGAERMPTTVSVVTTTTAPPPSYPGKAAPARCSDAGDCPPEMRGTPTCPNMPGEEAGRGDKPWGSACDQSAECEVGLYCVGGSCESPPSCETNADCDSGKCEDFVCQMEAERTELFPAPDASAKGAPKNFGGFKLGFDFGAISGEDVCNERANSGYVCFADGDEYLVGDSALRNPSNPGYNPSEGGSFSGSLAASTVRAVLSYERLFDEKFAAEVQLGLGFGGAPNTATAHLLHVAAYGKYWFEGTGAGLKWYGIVGGGIGQVDTHKSVGVAELPDERKSSLCDTTDVQGYCVFGGVDAYKKLGTSFIAAGAGGYANLGGHGPVVELLGKIMMPVSGVVFQPTIGWLYGF